MLKARIAAAALMLASLLTAGQTAQAQRVNPSRVIDLHLNMESDNQSFTGSVVEGKAFRITVLGVGTFEIMPVLVAEGRYAVAVHGGPEGAESADLRQVETLTVREGVPVALRSIPRVGLVIDGSRIAQPRAVVRPAAYTFASMPQATQDRCCVQCGDYVACGCKVDATCGFCCVEPCCPPPVITAEDRYFPRAPRFAARCGRAIRDEERLFTAPAGGARIAIRG